MAMRLAVIADPHFSETKTQKPRRGEIGDVLFERAVGRINALIKPDLVLLVGDLIDDPRSIKARAQTERLRQLADRLECPYLAIPGNHDVDPQEFYATFERPSDIVDVRGVRFMGFIDPEERDFNARRTPRDLSRIGPALEMQHGAAITFHHVPLFPPGLTDCPYNYTNAEDIIAELHENDVTLCVAGHWHEGFDVVDGHGLRYVAAPALCEPPFPILEIIIDGKRVDVVRHELKMPESLGLVDGHVHTEFAHCADDIVLERIPSLAADFGLAGVALAEHTHSLYFDKDTAWSAGMYRRGIAGASPDNDRVVEYIVAARRHFDAGAVGLEVDCDFQGRPIVREGHRGKVGFLVGAIHLLPERLKTQPDAEQMADEYLAVLQRFISSGISVLAHPFRIFHQSKIETPGRLFDPIVRVLREHGVAAEINCHANEPPPEFFRRCIDAGVKLVLGSDAHSLARIGELAPQLDVLGRAGYDGDLRDVLIDPRGRLKA